MTAQPITVFWFRRDLRLEDNVGLYQALQSGYPVLPLFIFDDASGELLGAHMVGEEVTEMINGYAIAQTLETTEQELMQTILPHPTMSEAMHEAVLAAYQRALHQ